MASQGDISVNVNPYKPSVLFVRHTFVGKQRKPDQTPQNVASDLIRVIHCLLTESSIKIEIKLKNTFQQPVKQKWVDPIDKIGKFHSV